jgi:hypothetical protein
MLDQEIEDAFNAGQALRSLTRVDKVRSCCQTRHRMMHGNRHVLDDESILDSFQDAPYFVDGVASVNGIVAAGASDGKEVSHTAASCLAIRSASSAGLSGAFTVEAWVKGPPQTNDAGIVTKGTGGGGEQFNIDCGAAGHGFRFFVRDTAGVVYLCASTVTPDNNWHHVVGVCDIPGGSVSLYVDGTLASSVPMTTALLASSRPVSIGGRQSGGGAYDLGFIGTVDEVAIYDRALGADVIQTHYAIGSDVPVLTVAADNKLRGVGAANPPFTVTYSGFINSDNQSLLSGSPSVTTTADAASPAGSYSIDVARGTLNCAKSYKFVFQAGTLSVIDQPQLTSVSQNGTQFTFTYPTVSGGTYQVSYKDDLSAANWTVLGAPVSGTGSPVTVSYDLSESPHRFFRLTVQ